MKISMEGSSVINLEQLSQYQDSLGYLGQQIIFQKNDISSKIFEETISKSHPGEDLLAYREVMMNYTLSEIKAIYTDTFDFSKNTHSI